MRRHAPALALCLAFSLSTFGQANNLPRDGNWWRGLSKDFKGAYVAGLFDGAFVGYDYSYWNLAAESTDKPCVDKMTESFNDNLRHLKNKKSGQIADGLDEFYKDFRNRSIRVRNAISYISLEISGASKEKLEKVLRDLRKEATGN